MNIFLLYRMHSQWNASSHWNNGISCVSISPICTIYEYLTGLGDVVNKTLFEFRFHYEVIREQPKLPIQHQSDQKISVFVFFFSNNNNHCTQCRLNCIFQNPASDSLPEFSSYVSGSTRPVRESRWFTARTVYSDKTAMCLFYGHANPFCCSTSLKAAACFFCDWDNFVCCTEFFNRLQFLRPICSVNWYKRIDKSE